MIKLYPTLSMVMDTVMSTDSINVLFPTVTKFNPDIPMNNTWKNVQAWTLPSNTAKYIGFGGETLLSMDSAERMPYLVAIQNGMVYFKCTPKWQTKSTLQFFNQIYNYFFPEEPILLHYRKVCQGSIQWIWPDSELPIENTDFVFSFQIPTAE